MSSGKCTFKQRDCTAAVKAVLRAGVAVKRVEIGTDGKIVVVIDKPDAVDADKGVNEWDSVIK